MLDPAALDDAVSEAFEREQIPFLERLVEQPSCSREPEDVELAAAIVDERAEALGWSRRAVQDPDGEVAAHRVYAPASLDPDETAIALVGHIDTVFPRSLGFFGFRREGMVARGPGVLDMKSGISAIFYALSAIRSVSSDTFSALSVRVVMNSDEEIGSRSSAPLLDRLAERTRAALVFECGRAEDKIVTARKGVGSFELLAEGRAAHAGLHHREGINAIEAIALAISPLQALTDYGRGVTVNVGLIEGGTSSNTVPPSARATVDVRYVHPEDGAELEARLRETIRAVALPPHLREAELSWSGRFHRPPMQPTEPSRRLMQAYERAAVAVGLGGGEAPLQGGGSDANLLAAAGVPVIDGLGPAGRGAHRVSEECDLTSLLRRTQALARFLVSEHRGSAE